MKKGKKVGLISAILAIICVIAGIILLVVGFITDKNSQSGTVVNVNLTDVDDSKPYITFNLNYAVPGDTLKATVNNSDDSYTYQWYLNNTAIDGATSDSYTITESDNEQFISFVATSTSSAYTSYSASLYVSELPVIYISTSEDIGDEYVDAKIATSGNSEYTLANTEFYCGDAQIKLRGNSTKNRDKAPYKIKLAEKSNLYNMGSSKHWVLLANDIDHTLIRNKLVYDLSGALGMTYMQSENVVVILDNSYQGVYQLCEQIRIASNRVDIYDYGDLAEEAATLIAKVKKETEGLTSSMATIYEEGLCAALKADYSWLSAPYSFVYDGEALDISEYVEIPSLTGGFILEMDFYNFTNVSSVLTNFNQPLYFNSPEETVAATNEELMTYAYNLVQSFEYAIHSYDFKYHSDETHYLGYGLYYDFRSGYWLGATEEADYTDTTFDNLHYTEIFDLDSLVNNWIICEFSMNWDSMKNSFFITKDIDTLAEISPEWDFDWAFGNINMYNIDTDYPTGWHTTNDYFTNEQYYQSVQWNRYLVKDPYFLKACYDKYLEIRPTLIEDIIKDGGTLDTYYEELYNAAIANDTRWSYTYSLYSSYGFEKSFKALREFIETRVAWLDEQFTSFDTFVESIGYYTVSDSITYTEASSDDGIISISVTDSNIKTLRVTVNGAAYSEDIAVVDGVATFQVPQSALTANGENVVNAVALDSNGEYLTTGTDTYSYNSDTTNHELLSAVQNYLVF